MKKIPTDKGSIKARKVLDDCGILDEPLDLEMEEIALSRGVTDVQSVKIDGAQGRIMVDEEEAIISYDREITHEGKRRFVIAHELGHFELHRNLLDMVVHTDDEKSLCEWYSKGKHEQEANQFASELLMPSHLFIDRVKGKQFDFDLIKNTGSFFESSLTSTLLKYKVLGDFPIAIIFCNNGIVEWSSFSEDFYLQFIPKNMSVPIKSVAYDFYNGEELPDEPEQIEAMDWFYQDFKVEEYEDINFYEQCIRVGKKGVLSCIWND